MQNKPQLSAEMESKFDSWWLDSSYPPSQIKGMLAKDFKHFLATALEEQKKFYEDKIDSLEWQIVEMGEMED